MRNLFMLVLTMYTYNAAAITGCFQVNVIQEFSVSLIMPDGFVESHSTFKGLSTFQQTVARVSDSEVPSQQILETAKAALENGRFLCIEKKKISVLGMVTARYINSAKLGEKAPERCINTQIQRETFKVASLVF